MSICNIAEQRYLLKAQYFPLSCTFFSYLRLMYALNLFSSLICSVALITFQLINFHSSYVLAGKYVACSPCVISNEYEKHNTTRPCKIMRRQINNVKYALLCVDRSDWFLELGWKYYKHPERDYVADNNNYSPFLVPYYITEVHK
jgi:hypothetical protein